MRACAKPTAECVQHGVAVDRFAHEIVVFEEVCAALAATERQAVGRALADGVPKPKAAFRIHVHHTNGNAVLWRLSTRNGCIE